MGAVSSSSKDARPLSKYAQKLRDQAEGKRAPFEFQEKRPHAETQAERVSAVVTTHVEGAMLLLTEKGDKLYLPLPILRRDCKGGSVKTGFVLECEIVPRPRGRDPRVTRIFSATPPSGTHGGSTA